MYDNEDVSGVATMESAPAKAQPSQTFIVEAGVPHMYDGGGPGTRLRKGTPELVASHVKELLGGKNPWRIEISAHFEWGIKLDRMFYKECSWGGQEQAELEMPSAGQIPAIVQEMLNTYSDLTYARISVSV